MHLSAFAERCSHWNALIVTGFHCTVRQDIPRQSVGAIMNCPVCVSSEQQLQITPTVSHSWLEFCLRALTPTPFPLSAPLLRFGHSLIPTPNPRTGQVRRPWWEMAGCCGFDHYLIICDGDRRICTRRVCTKFCWYPISRIITCVFNKIGT